MRPSFRAAFLFACLVALPLVAQDAPPPPPPFPPPITGYVGRFVDSSRTMSWQLPPRTYRATVIKAAPEFDRLYMIVGSTFVGQTLSTFPARVAAGPLLTAPHGEKYLNFEKWVDAERTPGWTMPLQDSQDRLYDFDWDDRGNIYLAYSIAGLGIINSDFQLLRQYDTFTSAEEVVAFRRDSDYYVLTGPTPNLLKVNDPAIPTGGTPVTLPTFRDSARTRDFHVALVTFSGALQIFTPEGLITSGTPLQSLPGTFRAVTTDGTNFYAVDTTQVHILQPAGASFTDTIAAPLATSSGSIEIDYGAGYLTVVRNAGPVIFRVDGTSLTLLSDETYFNAYRTSLSATHPYVQPRRMLPVVIGTQTYLAAALFGLGDLFTIASPTPLAVTKQFSPSTIASGAVSQLSVTITNPNGVPVSFGFQDTYPTNLVNGSGATLTTCGGTITATAGAGSFQITGASLAANATCTVTVPVTSSIPGTYVNTLPAGAIVSADNTNTAASASLTVSRLAAPIVQKAFAVTRISPGVPFRMTITIQNPNATSIQGLAFTDTYPAPLANGTPVNAVNTCGGTLLAAPGGTSLSISGGTVPASQTCTIALDVVATGTGVITNTLGTGSVTSTNAEPSAAAATATIAAAAAEPIPTLSEWALLAMAGFLAIAAMLRFRG